MTNPLQILNLNALPVLVLAVLTFAAASASAQSDEVLMLDIKPQKAGSALTKLARSSGVQIMITEGDGATVEVEGLKGEYRFEDALAALLTDTGLTYEYVAENVVTVQQDEQAGESDDPDASDDIAEPEEDEPIELAPQKVTGTRLTKGDPSARIITFTREDMKRRGVSDLEELVRLLPWNFASITDTTVSQYGGGVSDTDFSLGEYGLGTATVNLRSMGSSATLVLVNGRRVASRGGSFYDIVNILNLPMSAVERVEIQLDGASAVYGADAIGGVMNIITRKGFKGISANYRQEFSATGADRKELSALGGYGWRSGEVSVDLSRHETKPINNLKIWNSNDFTDQFGPEFDLRVYNVGQPGVVCEHNGLYGYDLRCKRFSKIFQLQAGHSGAGATVDDFSSDLAPFDYVEPQNGSESTRDSISVRIEQHFGDNLKVNAGSLYSKRESYREYDPIWDRYLVPASNAYNPFGRHVIVSYWPIREIQAGLIPSAYAQSTYARLDYEAGFSWEFADGHELKVAATRSKSYASPRVSRATYSRGIFDPTQEKFYAALDSSDPNVALNLFGDGTRQGKGFPELLTSTETLLDGTTRDTIHDAVLRGSLFRIWAGPISYAIGTEWRKRSYGQRRGRMGEDGLTWDDGYRSQYGISLPEREITAYFVELALPIVGEENSLPGVRLLDVSLQARRDEYISTGATGGVSLGPWDVRSVLAYVPGEGWRDDLGYDFFRTREGTPEVSTLKQSANSPRIGLRYKPVDSIMIRAAASRSFKPPLYLHSFSALEPADAIYALSDFFYPDPDSPGQRAYRTVYPILAAQRRYNPNLKSEFAKKISAGFELKLNSLAELQWDVNWSKVDYTDKVESKHLLLFNYPEVASGLPSIVERDANGYPTRVLFGRINVAGKVSEILESSIRFGFETNVGRFTPRLSYTRVLSEAFEIVEGGEIVERVGTAYGSDKYRLSGHLNWVWRRFNGDLFVRYIPGYKNDRTGRCGTTIGRCTYRSRRPSLDVSALMTVDLSLVYQWSDGLTLRAGGRNILYEKSQTIWQSLPYDPVRWNARGRVFYFELNWEM